MIAKKLLGLALLIGLSLASCEKNDEEQPQPDPTPVTVKDVSYATQVKPIFDNNCIGCHGNTAANAGFNFQGYTNLSQQVSKPALLGALKHQAGFSPMPQGRAKLSDTQIKLIEVWIAEGAKDN